MINYILRAPAFPPIPYPNWQLIAYTTDPTRWRLGCRFKGVE